MGILPGLLHGLHRGGARRVSPRQLRRAGADGGRSPGPELPRAASRPRSSGCSNPPAGSSRHPIASYAIGPEETPPNLLINPYDVRTFSLNSLTKRLRTVGLASRACDEITKRGNLYYENAWNEYEEIHGEEHPRRYFDRLAPAAS